MADSSVTGAPAGRGSGHEGATILLVEDHLDTAVVFERLLVRRGYRVLRAATLAEGLALSQQPDVDLVVSDLSLPDGSGLDVLRRPAGSRPLPAIALSGYGGSGDEQRSREAGFSRHLVKPVEFSVLDAAIQELLGPS